MLEKKPLFIILFLLSAAVGLQAQPMIRGTVQDTSNHSFLPNASVVLLRARDSVLQAYCTTAVNGSFSLRGVDTGRSILLVSYPGYADYTDFVYIKGKSVDLGRITLTNKVTVLREVVVRGVIPAIRIKGDTTEYTADSFRVRPNATVEELLKQLPGVQVDRNGKITAQGEQVKKVLVDGEEFFGDDPTLVTRNLRAEMIKKVQIYDKKSDQAAFTGIDDGVRDKTVNLQLKDNSKKGSFGRIDLGASSNGYSENQGMANFFRGKERFSIYSILSNTGRVGLAWQDNNAYAGQNDQSASKNIELDAWDGNYSGQGIPIARTGGVHYNNLWNNDKFSLNANYKGSDLDISGSNNSISQNNLPDNIYLTDGDQVFRNRILKNKLQATSVIKLDSGSMLKIDLSDLLAHKKTDSRFASETRQSDSSLLNRGTRSLADDAQKNTFDGGVLWEKKFRKKGRTISIDLHGNYISNHIKGYLYSNDSYFGIGGVEDSASLIDQFKDNHANVSLLDGKAVYTEPLSSFASLIFDYELIAGHSGSTIRTYEKSADSTYDSLDSLYSNDYRFSQLTHKGGAGLSLASGKWRGYAGTDVGVTGFQQGNPGKAPFDSRKFMDWYPHFSMDYLFSLQKQIGLSYEGNTVQPSVDQLQPILNNYDPLNIIVGNPGLDPVYTNLISIHYNNYQPATRGYIFSNFNYSFSGNQVTTDAETDSTGVTVYHYENRKGYGRYWGYLGYGGRIPKWLANWGFNLSVGGSRSENQTNGLTNVLTASTSGLEGYFNMGKKDKYELELRGSASYNTNKSSLQAHAPQDYWVYLLSPSAAVFLPARVELHTNVNYTIRQKTAAFNADLNVFLWNAWIGKYLLKKDALLIKLAANDLLNQNKGVTRNIAGNFISQNTFSTVRQFFLLSLVWSFSGTGGVATGSPAAGK